MLFVTHAQTFIFKGHKNDQHYKKEKKQNNQNVPDKTFGPLKLNFTNNFMVLFMCFKSSSCKNV